MNFISLKQFSTSTGPRFNQSFATDRKKYTGTSLRNLYLKPSSRIVWHRSRTPTYFLTSYEVPSTQSCSYLNASRSKSWAPWAMCASSQQPTEKLWTSLQMWRNQKVYVCVFLLLNDETINAWMCTQHFFCLDADSCRGDGLWTTSVVRTRSFSVCAVTRSLIHGVLRSQTIPQPTRLVYHVACRQRVLVSSRNLAGTTLLRYRLLSKV